MKIVFAGSPEFAVPAFKRLISEGENIICALTQPDRPVGRKRILTPTAVKAAALGCGVPVLDFARVRDHTEEIKALNADIMITCAYGQILSDEILNCFPSGVWNLHASLLPEFRGASPIQSAILAGESYTGITVMKTEAEMDAGDILLVKRCEVGNSTYGQLSEKLSLIAAECAVEAVKLIKSKNIQLLVQDSTKATYCKKVKKEDGKVDFSAKARDICLLIKAYSPDPCAYCTLNGTIINLFDADFEEGKAEKGKVIQADKHGIRVGCGDGILIITELQPGGGKRMPAAQFVNGRKIKVGDCFD